MQSKQTHRPGTGPIKQPNRIRKSLVEELHRPGDSQCSFLCAFEGDRFRRQFAEDNVQKSDNAERNRERYRVQQRFRDSSSQGNLQKVRDSRLANPAERQRSQSDAELGRRNVGVQVIDPRSVLARPSPAAAIVAMRDRRTPTSANSEATKNPLARTRKKTAAIFSVSSMSNSS